MSQKTWFKKMLDEVKDTPEFKAEMVRLYKDEIAVLKAALAEKDKEIEKLRKVFRDIAVDLLDYDQEKIDRFLKELEEKEPK